MSKGVFVGLFAYPFARDSQLSVVSESRLAWNFSCPVACNSRVRGEHLLAIVQWNLAYPMSGKSQELANLWLLWIELDQNMPHRMERIVCADVASKQLMYPWPSSTWSRSLPSRTVSCKFGCPFRYLQVSLFKRNANVLSRSYCTDKAALSEMLAPQY